MKYLQDRIDSQDNAFLLSAEQTHLRPSSFMLK